MSDYQLRPVCPECGSEISHTILTCPECGAKLTPADTPGGGSAPESGRLIERFAKWPLELLLFITGVFFVTGFSFLIVFMKWEDPATFNGQSLEHTNMFITTLLATIAVVIVVTIVTALMGRLPFIRRIAGLNAIDEAVGRATEMGRPIIFSSGLAGLSIISLQALAIGSHIARYAARYGTRFIVPVCDQSMMPITEQVLREVYASEGVPERYREEDVRFLSDRQFAYAAGVTGIMHRSKPGASFLFGQFFAESLILAENGQAVGAIQVAGTPDLLQTPFFVVTCDYTLIGDEFYAASAYLSKEPTQLGSLVGQDLGKAMLLLLIVVGMIWAIYVPDAANPIMNWLGGKQ